MSKIDGVDLHTVVIMGIVESVEEHSTIVTFRVNDGTGSMEGKLWNDKGSSGGQSSKIARCRYRSDYISAFRLLIFDLLHCMLRRFPTLRIFTPTHHQQH